MVWSRVAAPQMRFERTTRNGSNIIFHSPWTVSCLGSSKSGLYRTIPASARSPWRGCAPKRSGGGFTNSSHKRHVQPTARCLPRNYCCVWVVFVLIGKMALKRFCRHRVSAGSARLRPTQAQASHHRAIRLRKQKLNLFIAGKDWAAPLPQ